jgi:hypothetical protein
MLIVALFVAKSLNLCPDGEAAPATQPCRPAKAGLYVPDVVY